MGASFIDPSTILWILLTVLGGGVRDLASCLSTDAYWHANGVAVSVEQLTRELDPIRPADVTKLVADLDADDPKTRDEATAKIAAIGPGAIPGPEDAAKNGSPEVIARANALLANIHAGSKAAAVRRLMAIRTLGEKKDAAALPALRPLLGSREMFEADYAKSAIAKIEGKSYSTPVASDADRSADVALLPAKLDVVAQVAPEIDGGFSIDAMISQLPTDAAQKAKAREEANSQILKLLDEVGNVRLDSLTWGFYAAPPGQPGNTMVIARGIFDPVALTAMLGKHIAKSSKVDGVDVFQMDDDTALLVSSDGHVVFLSREPGGDLSLETMAAALKKSGGDFAANPDLPALLKSLDTKSPLWAAAKLDPGMKEIVGPLGDFDTATIVAKTSRDKDDKIVSEIHLEASTTDAAKAKQAVEAVQAELKGVVEEGRQEEKLVPFMKPLVDFVESIKLSADGGKATLNGSMRDMSVLPGIFLSETHNATPGQAPAPVRH